MSSDAWSTRPAGQRAEELARLRDAVTTTSVTHSSPNQLVTVTVGAGGALTALALASAAVAEDERQLGPLIVATIEQATQRLKDDLAAATAEITGGRGFTNAINDPLPAVPTWEQVRQTVPLSRADALEVSDVDSDDDTVGKLLRESQERLRRYAEFQTASAGERTSATSPDGAVSATVRAAGVVEAVDFDRRRLAEYDAARLGSTVLAVIQSARAEAALRLARRLQEMTGPAVNVLAMITAVRETGSAVRENGPDDPGGR